MVLSSLIFRPVLLSSEPGKTILEKFRIDLFLSWCLCPEQRLHWVWSSGSSSSPSSLYFTELSVLLFCVCSWLPYCIPEAQNLQQTPFLEGQEVAMKAEEHTAWRVFHLHLGEGQAKQTNRVLNTVSCLSFFPNVSSHSSVSGQAAQTLLWIWTRVWRGYTGSCSSGSL